MSRFKVTSWDTTNAREPVEVRSVTLVDLMEEAATTTRAVKTDLPLVKLATYGTNASDKGSLRWGGNITAITGIEGDYDDGVMTMAEAVAKLTAANVMFGTYTSFSHTPDKPRWRVFCPLSTPMPLSRRGPMLARINGVLGGMLSEESFTDAQCYYLGSDAAKDPRDADWHTSRAGRFIDLCPDLDLGALGKRKPSQREVRVAGLASRPSTDGARQALQLAVAEILACDGTNRKYMTTRGLCMRIASLVLGNFLDEDEAREAIVAAADEAGADRLDPVEALWESAMRKAKPAVPVSDGAELGPLPDETPDEILAARGGRRMRLASDLKLAAAQPYIVKDLIRRGDVGIILGAPGAGKSMLAPLIGYRIALGLPVFGMRSRQGRVLYAVAEDAHGMDHRIMALRSELGTTDDFAVVTIENLGDKIEADALMADVRNWQPTLVFIDTLPAAWAGMVENDSADMGKVVEFARRIAATGAGVILIHHPAKNSSDKTPRGHSSLNGTADWILLLGDRDDGIVQCTVSKNRAGRSDLDIAFSQRSIVLGRDEDGEPVTAPMAVELAPRRPEDRKPDKPLPQWISVQLGILTNLITASGQESTTRDQWREACLASGGMGVRSAFNDKFRRLKVALENAKRVVIKGENVRLVSSAVTIGDLADNDCRGKPVADNFSTDIEHLQRVKH